MIAAKTVTHAHTHIHTYTHTHARTAFTHRLPFWHGAECSVDSNGTLCGQAHCLICLCLHEGGGAVARETEMKREGDHATWQVLQKHIHHSVSPSIHPFNSFPSFGSFLPPSLPTPPLPSPPLPSPPLTSLSVMMHCR